VLPCRQAPAPDGMHAYHHSPLYWGSVGLQISDGCDRRHKYLAQMWTWAVQKVLRRCPSPPSED
jgi:hypothetical protein